MFEFLLFVALLLLGYFAGRVAEARHYRSIRRREQASLRMEIATSRAVEPGSAVTKAFLVSGSTVVSPDYFKRVASALRKLFGGRISAYEGLLDRARREALLRMKKQALLGGASKVINVRMETSTIGGVTSRRRHIVGVEVLAYGTALKTT